MREKWQATESKIAEYDDTVMASLRELHAALNAIRADGNYNLVHDLICLPSFKTFTAIWNSGSAEEDNALSMFWQSYSDMVSLLLHFIRATREGNWQLHLTCVRSMLPCFFL